MLIFELKLLEVSSFLFLFFSFSFSIFKVENKRGGKSKVRRFFFFLPGRYIAQVSILVTW